MLDMYQENILEHYKNPQNSGVVENPTFKHRELNPLCGDEIIVTGLVNEHDVLTSVKFTGGGCAISQASMSMLSESIQEKSVDEINEISHEHIIDMLGIPIGPVRLKCALLGLNAIRKGIALRYQNGITH